MWFVYLFDHLTYISNNAECICKLITDGQTSPLNIPSQVPATAKTVF